MAVSASSERRLLPRTLYASPDIEVKTIMASTSSISSSRSIEPPFVFDHGKRPHLLFKKIEFLIRLYATAPKNYQL